MFDLKAFRKENGIKQIDVAEWLNCGQSNVSMLEKNMNLSEHQISLIKDHCSIDISKYFVSNKNIKPIVTNEAELVTEIITKRVPLVNQYAYAGYLTGYQDQEYIDQLPKIPFDSEDDPNFRYMAFEMKGNSMDDGSRDSYIEGDKLFCQEIPSHMWDTSKLHTMNWNFVIVHKEGIIVRKIIDHDTQNHIIKVHPLNPFIKDQIINLVDVYQIFNVIEYQRKTRR